MKTVFGIVTSELDLKADVESVGCVYNSLDVAISEMIKLIESEQEITLTPKEIEEIEDCSQYITSNEEFAYTIVDFQL